MANLNKRITTIKTNPMNPTTKIITAFNKDLERLLIEEIKETDFEGFLVKSNLEQFNEPLKD